MRTLMVVLFLGVVCANGHSQQVTFGSPVAGVQLAISVTNDIVLSSSTNIILCWTRNNSTNDISIIEGGFLEDDYSAISLTDQSGKTYDLRAHIPFRAYYSNIVRAISAGQTYQSRIVIVLNDKFVSGPYKLQVKRRFVLATASKGLPHSGMEVSSNILKVKLIKLKVN